jgi:probable selenium-dependent hydroxylase accessory protein YqeC
MAQSGRIVSGRLSESVGLETRELVAIVGAGGKTTILRALGTELASAGHKVILTTTTKMAPEQMSESVIWSDEPTEVERSLTPGTALFVLAGETHNRVTGPPPESIDRLFSSTTVDHIIVEADGARTKSIKAPSDHEPPIPSTSTTVIVVVGADALGQQFESVAHRLDRIGALTGANGDDVVTPNAVAEILLHPKGGLKGVPDAARVVMAISKVDPSSEAAATELADLLERHPRTDRAVLLRRLTA